MAILKSIFRWLLVVGVVVLIALASRRWIQKREEAAREVPPIERAPWALHTAPLHLASLQKSWRCLGTLRSIAEFTVASQFPGAILELGPREGTPVKAGQVMARIDTREFDHDLKAKRELLTSAKTDAARLQDELGREKALLKDGGSTASKVEERDAAAVAAASRVHSLQAEIQAMEVRRAYAVVKSPVDGVVMARLAEPGDLCAAYHPLFKLQGAGAARLTLRLPQDVLHRVKVGSAIAIRNGEQEQEVLVSRIHPELDREAMGLLDADLPGLPFGMPSASRIAARLILQRWPKSLVVPHEAIFQRDGHATLLVIRRHENAFVATPTDVEILFRGDDAVAVAALDKAHPLREGDQVAVDRSSQLLRVAEGDRVLPSPR